MFQIAHPQNALLAVLLWLCGSLGTAAEETVSFPVEKYPEGTVFVYRDNAGGTERIEDVTLAVKVPGVLKLEVKARQPAPPNPRTYLTDEVGNVLLIELADGREILFKPHNCGRVVGLCNYVRIDPDGTIRNMRGEFSMTGRLREGRVLDERGFILGASRVTFDADGLAILIESSQPNTTAPEWTRRELIEVLPPQ